MNDKNLAQRLTEATTKQTSYQPNDMIAKQMQKKVLVMLVSPAAMGKSYLIKRAAGSAPDLSQVSVFTTRGPRPDDDPGMFRSLLTEEQINGLLDKIENGEVVQYVIHPTHHTVYGSEISDYRSRYNLLAMLSGGVETMRMLPFGGTVTIGLITDPATWQKRFDTKFPPGHPERPKRLQEAVISLEWLAGQPAESLWWLINNDDNLTASIERLTRLCHGRSGFSQDGKQLAIDCLTLAKTLH
ncbi:MAG: hypothetical protein WBP26_03615 [Candidatus Saccharimonadales bacterium]